MPPKAAPKKSAPGKAGSKGKSAPAKGPVGKLAMLKAQMEAQKKAEEEAERLAQEEEARLKEEERLAEEQRKFEEAEKQRLKEQNKADAKAGKTGAKRNAQAEAIERMRAAGMIVPDMMTEDEKKAEAEKKKAIPKPAPKKKATPAEQKNKHVDVLAEYEPVEPSQKLLEEEKKKKPATPPPAKDEEEEEVDDWEALMGDDEEEPAAAEGDDAAAADEEEPDTSNMSAAATAELDASETATTMSKKSATSTKKSYNAADLRSPICCVLGHVDTGKTSLLDKIRRTNVQGGEAGGITQQIGATFFPKEGLEKSTAELRAKFGMEMKVPGLLVIDTPGHESFTNLRSRGSNLCDIAVLVVDIMHGLEPQTKESLKLLRQRKCPFIVALNKVDRLYEWESTPNGDIQSCLAKQKQHVRDEFDNRCNQILTEFAEEGFNAELYFKNKDVKTYVSVVPTSAHTGEGIPDLLMLEIQLVQRFMEGKVAFKDDLECTVLEVKPVQGIGTTVDVVLVNGTLHYGDEICICGMNGPIHTRIRALLTPQPLKELRVKGEYIRHDEVKAAMGIKIAAENLEQAVPGTPLYVVHNDIERAEAEKNVMKDFQGLLSNINHHGEGVAVQSSTLGAMEALLSFLEDSKIPVSSVGLGEIHKNHLIKMQAMKEKNPKFAVMLAFDVSVSKEAQAFADQHGIKIMKAQIIYHLFDQFTQYVENFDEIQKEANRKHAIFPAVVKINGKIREKNPIILDCTVEKGQLHPGTPLIVRPSGLAVGKVASMEKNRVAVKVAKKGFDIAVSLASMDSNLTFGRQFDEKSSLASSITRKSIDALKESFRSEMDDTDWNLIKALAKEQGVPVGGKAKKPAPKKEETSPTTTGGDETASSTTAGSPTS